MACDSGCTAQLGRKKKEERPHAGHTMCCRKHAVFAVPEPLKQGLRRLRELQQLLWLATTPTIKLSSALLCLEGGYLWVGRSLGCAWPPVFLSGLHLVPKTVLP